MNRIARRVALCAALLVAAVCAIASYRDSRNYQGTEAWNRVTSAVLIGVLTAAVSWLLFMGLLWAVSGHATKLRGQWNRKSGKK